MGNCINCIKDKIFRKNRHYERQNTAIMDDGYLSSEKDLKFEDKKRKKSKNEYKTYRQKNHYEFENVCPENNNIKKSSNNNEFCNNKLKNNFHEETLIFKRLPTKESIDCEPKEIELMNKVSSLEKDIKEISEKLKENEDIKKKYTSLKDENDKITKNIISLQNIINELKEKDNNLQKKNEELQNENKEIKDKNILFQKEIKEIKEIKEKIKEKEILLEKNNKEMQNQSIELIKKNILLEKQIKKIYEENLKKAPILVGLNDIGGTYYMNATLQCLSNTDELTEFILNKYEPNDKSKIISNEYYNVIKNLWDRDNDNKSFSPKEFKEALSRENPLFSGIGGNASKDLINFLLERIHIELNNIKKENKVKLNNYMSSKFDQNNQFNEQIMLNLFTNEFKKEYNSIISDLFFGILETKSQCQRCLYFKYNFQVYNFIEFPLERVNQYCFNTGKRMNYNMYNDKNPDIDLYECFEFHNKIEPMFGDNQMYCSNCNDNCDFLYCSSLYSTPKYLIINFFRGRGEVYECNVNFPEQLNLFNFVSDKNIILYELYGVICQIGPSSKSGPFIAFCKNRIDKKWYKYNDDVVTLCENSNEFRSGMPYILFYKVLFNN